MSDELPDGWSSTTLGAACTVKARIGWRGLSASEYTPDGPLLIAGKHIRAGQIDWDACDHLSDIRYDESPEIQLRCGDVILSKDGSIGNPALVESLPGRATINGTMMMLRPDEHQIHPDYLFQFVNGPAFSRMIAEKVSGSSIPHIFQRDIVHFPIVLPPVEEQRRISELLRSLDVVIEANLQVIEACKAVVDAYAAQLLADSQAADKTIRIDQLGPVVTGRTPPPTNAELWVGDLPFFTPGDLSDGIIGVANAQRSLDVHSNHGCRMLPAGSVLVTCIGSTIGKAGIGRVACVTNQQINAICCSPEVSGFVYLICRGLFEEIAANAGRQAVPIINKSTFSALRVAKRDLAEMREISEAVDKVDTQMSLARAILRSTKTLKANVTADLLSGRVRVPA